MYIYTYLYIKLQSAVREICRPCLVEKMYFTAAEGNVLLENLLGANTRNTQRDLCNRLLRTLAELHNVYL